jgi:hypothetical protein
MKLRFDPRRGAEAAGRRDYLNGRSYRKGIPAWLEAHYDAGYQQAAAEQLQADRRAYSRAVAKYEHMLEAR